MSYEDEAEAQLVAAVPSIVPGLVVVMAVGRVKASHQWFRAAALSVKDHPKIARELLRAASRPGRTAELTADEARVLALNRPTDSRATLLLEQVEASERREADRHAALQQRLYERRGF